MMPSLVYAGRFERLLAYVIDSSVLLVTATLLSKVGGPQSLFAIFGSLACQLAYVIVSTASPWQATPGQRMIGMYVAKLDGKLLTERDALERFLAYIMPTLPINLSIAPIEVLAMATTWLVVAWFSPILWRDDRRGVHDVLCNTVVLSGKR